MDKKVRVGIIGTGGMAHIHADNLKKITGVELTACLDTVPGRAEAYAQKHGVKHTAKNLDDLFRQVDAVAIVTPDRFHAEPTIAALHAGKHVLCEKPLTVTLDEARTVAGAAAKSGVIHIVNFSYRGSAALQHAMELAAAGTLGALRHVHSFYLQSWLASDIWGNWSGEGFLWRLETGGVLADVGCHILDLTTAVAGDVKRIRCDLRTFPKIDPAGQAVTEFAGKKLDANDTAVIELELTGGAVAIVHTTRWATGHKNHLRLEAAGTDGALAFDLDEDWHAIRHCLGADRHKAAWTTHKLEPTPNNWQRFIHAIRTGTPDQPDILRGAQIQAYLDACERSAKSGHWETVHDWR
jgi:predicted dehydrogenase